MSETDEPRSIQVSQSTALDSNNLRQREETLLNTLEAHGLPRDSIFVDVDERAIVFKNVGDVIKLIDPSQRYRAVYISKFVAAVASGLFDAALNYLWDETVSELRRRVASYDLSYFYDHAIKNEDRRKTFKSESDLQRVEDQELINAAREIELISEIGLKQLDLIRYMRNFASAAHPNQNKIDGLTLIQYLNACIKEVIALPFSSNVIKIKRLLENIRTTTITEEEAVQTAAFFLDLTQDQANAIGQGFFGIYTRTDSATSARNNITLLAPRLWPRIDETTKTTLGIKYAQFIANSQQQERQFASEFLDVVGGQTYAPEAVRIAQIATTLDNLQNAHRGSNNFYSEPVFAKELERIVGDPPKIPRQVEELYALTLCEVYLTNGYGTAWNASEIYRRLIGGFSSHQALVALLSFASRNIRLKLARSLCAQQFMSLLDLLETIITAPAAKELLAVIRSFRGPKDRLSDDADVRRKVEAIRKLLPS